MARQWAMGGGFVEVDGAQLWAVTEGVSGPPVVVLHGGPGLPDYTAALAELLTDTCRVVRYEQRGCGRSDRAGPWSLERYIADLDGLRAAFGAQRWHVVGHSWGATLGLLYALEHPERVASLAYLAGTGIEWPRWKASYHEEAASRWSPQERRRLAELAADPSPAADAERVTLQLRVGCRHPDDHRAAIAELAHVLADGANQDVNRVLNREVESLDPAELERRCSALSTPVLAVHGTQDPRPADAVASLVAALPDVNHHFVDAGHELWFQQPERLKDLLVDHIARSEQRAGND